MPGHATAPAAQPEHHRFVQAPIRPLDENGITATLVGTALFTVATVVLLVLRPTLDAEGRGWWLWVGISGVVLGLVGYAYCRRRASRGA